MAAIWFAVWQTQFSPEQWAAFGSMLGAVGSMLAVLGAGALVTVEIGARRREAARYAQERRDIAAEQREREARRREETAWRARLVLAELGISEQNPDDPHGNTISQYIDVANEGDAFVFDVIVRIPGFNLRKVIHFIRPGSTESTEFRGVPNDYHVQHIGCGGPLTPYALRVTIEFTDASGRRWRRHGWDQPLRLPDELANPEFYRALPPFSYGEHEYDLAVTKLGVEVIDEAIR